MLRILTLNRIKSRFSAVSYYSYCFIRFTNTFYHKKSVREIWSITLNKATYNNFFSLCIVPPLALIFQSQTLHVSACIFSLPMNQDPGLVGFERKKEWKTRVFINITRLLCHRGATITEEKNYIRILVFPMDEDSPLSPKSHNRWREKLYSHLSFPDGWGRRNWRVRRKARM